MGIDCEGIGGVLPASVYETLCRLWYRWLSRHRLVEDGLCLRWAIERAEEVMPTQNLATE